MSLTRLTLLLLISLIAIVASQDGSFDSATIWDKYRAELLRFISKGTNDPSLRNLQLLANPVFLSWHTDPSQFQMYANSRMDLSTPLFQLDMRRFSDSYEEFILALKGNGPAKQNAALEVLYDQESEKQEEYQTDLGRCFMKYESLNENLRGTFDSFKRNMCWSLERVYQEYMALRARIEVQGRQAYGSEKDYQLAKALGKYGSSVSQDFLELTTLSNFVRRNNAGQYNKFELTIDQGTASSEGSSSWSKTSFNIGFPGYFSIGYNSAKKKMKLTTKKEQFKMKFGAQSWTAIRVMPDPKWFSGNVLKEWANGPYKAGFSRGTFFGSTGKLSMVPQTFYVISKPHVELILNRDDYEQIESAKSSGISLSIGPVAFGFNKAKTTAKLDEKNNLFQFRIEGNDDAPQLIAVKGDVLPF